MHIAVKISRVSGVNGYSNASFDKPVELGNEAIESSLGHARTFYDNFAYRASQVVYESFIERILVMELGG